MIVACQHDENRVRSRSQVVIAQLRRGRGDDGTFIQLVMKMTLSLNIEASRCPVSQPRPALAWYLKFLMWRSRALT